MKIWLSLISILISTSAFSSNVEKAPIDELYKKIVGLPARHFMKNLDVEALKTFDEKFDLIFKDRGFIENNLGPLVSRLSDESDNPFLNVDDYQVSLLLAMTSDIDLRRVFTRSYVIQDSDAQVARPALLNDSGFDVLYEKYQNYELKFKGDKARTYSEGFYNGIFTTVGFGMKFLMGGTNRKPIRGIYDIFLCSKIESYKDPGLNAHFIGPDIDRMPGDKPEIFQERCSACHAPMDAQRGSFAKHDFTNNETVLLNEISEKYNRNPKGYGGYQTIDDSWTNLLTGPLYQEIFGWRTKTSGRGISSFANMIVSSKRFSECLTQKVVKQVCGHSEEQLSNENMKIEIKNIARKFEDQKYKFKSLVKEVVRSPLLCSE